jgi:hypothetical protein
MIKYRNRYSQLRVIFMKKKPRFSLKHSNNYSIYGPFGLLYTGISNDPVRRIGEHRRMRKFFTDYQISPSKPRSQALTDETRVIHQFQDDHWGGAPLYNKAKLKKDKLSSRFWGWSNQ